MCSLAPKIFIDESLHQTSKPLVSESGTDLGWHHQSARRILAAIPVDSVVAPAVRRVPIDLPVGVTAVPIPALGVGDRISKHRLGVRRKRRREGTPTTEIRAARIMVAGIRIIRLGAMIRARFRWVSGICQLPLDIGKGLTLCLRIGQLLGLV